MYMYATIAYCPAIPSGYQNHANPKLFYISVGVPLTAMHYKVGDFLDIQAKT